MPKIPHRSPPWQKLPGPPPRPPGPSPIAVHETVRFPAISEECRAGCHGSKCIYGYVGTVLKRLCWCDCHDIP